MEILTYKNGRESVYDAKDGKLSYVSNSNVIILTSGAKPLSILIAPSSGSSSILTSISPIVNVMNESAIWNMWAKGIVGDSTDDVLLYPVNALKLAVYNGQCSLSIVGNLL